MKAGSGQFIPLRQGVDGHTEQLNKSRDWHTLRVSADGLALYAQHQMLFS